MFFYMADAFTFVAPDFGKSPMNFFKEVRAELAKVAWPKRPEVIKLTAVVVGASVLVGIYLGGLDFVFSKLIEFLLRSLK